MSKDDHGQVEDEEKEYIASLRVIMFWFDTDSWSLHVQVFNNIWAAISGLNFPLGFLLLVDAPDFVGALTTCLRNSSVFHDIVYPS